MGPLAQVAPGPLDTLRFPLEQQLLDMVRHGEQDYCKGRPEQAARAPSCYAEYRGPAGALEDALARQARGRAFSGRRLRSLTPLCPCAARGFSRRKGRPWAASGCRERSGLCLGAGKSPFFLDGAELVLEEQRCSPKGGDVAAGAERYSRKVFVGGLPPDIDEEEITASFRRFGPLVVDWPHKAESKSYFPPKGYAFLLFQDECSVQALMDACIQEEDKLYLCVSSPTIKDKPVQIRPWRLGDADFVLDASLPLDPRKTVFVGGVPRPLKAVELAMIMDRLYGGVCYAGIDTDPELKYPKGAGRVAFSNQQSYIAAISARFVQLQHGDIEKRVGACVQGRLRGRHQKRGRGGAGVRIIKRGARLENEGGEAPWQEFAQGTSWCMTSPPCTCTPDSAACPLAGGGEAVRARRPDVRRVPGGPVRRQVCALLLRQCDLPAVLLRALLGHHPLPARPRVSQAAGQGRRRPAPGRTLPLVLGGGCDSSPRDNQRLVGPPAGHG